MCLAIPACVEKLTTDNQAIVNLSGIRKTVSLVLVENIQPGDYVIVHVGFALQRLDLAEAERTLALFAEMSSLDNQT